MKNKFVVLNDRKSRSQKLKILIEMSYEIAKAELYTKQFQRFLGPVWWMIEPSLMSFVFFFLTTRLNYTTGDNHFMFIFVGITVYNFFRKSLEQSPLLYLNYSVIIKQVNFPLIASNFSIIITELIFFLCGLIFVILFGYVTNSVNIGISIFFLPIVMLSLILLTLSLSILISCIGVYIRDIVAPLTLALSVIFFLSPGIYKPENLTGILKFLSIINPFFYFLPACRDIILYNKIPDFKPLLIWTLFSIFVLVLSLKIYNYIRPRMLRVF